MPVKYTTPRIQASCGRETEEKGGYALCVLSKQVPYLRQSIGEEIHHEEILPKHCMGRQNEWKPTGENCHSNSTIYRSISDVSPTILLPCKCAPYWPFSQETVERHRITLAKKLSWQFLGSMAFSVAALGRILSPRKAHLLHNISFF